jgi:endonuclease/exonuclease/phosphatase family metal-dependent hydrolase
VVARHHDLLGRDEEGSTMICEPVQAAPTTRTRALALALLALMLLVMSGPAASAAPPPHARNDRAFTVMTRNLYLGASLAPLFPDPPLQSPAEVFLAATQVWHQVASTDFPARAGALAEEVAATTPDIIGLQEVTRYAVRPLASTPGMPFEPRMDFLEMFLDELADRGQDYRVVASQEAFTGTLPAAEGDGTPVAVNLTDRDVILVRSGPETASIKVTNPQSGLFTAALPLEVGGQPLPIVRGWTSVDVAYRGRAFRVVNTHLEAFHEGIALLQAQELVTTGPAATELPVVLLGDINSAPGEPAYGVLAGAGFADADAGGQPTCCYDAPLADPTSTLTTRIDVVLHRGPISVAWTERVGVEPFQGEAPLWASDHVGVVAELVIR